MKISRKNTIVFSIIALIVIAPYVYFKSFDEYTQKVDGDIVSIVSKDGDAYYRNKELTNDGKVHYDKKVGRIKGIGFFETIFWGPWVYTHREYDKKEALVVRVPFDDYVYLIK